MNAVAMAIKGNIASKTNENDHPLVNAITNPDTVIPKGMIIRPIFSPTAFYIAKVSFPILAESSEGLCVSNQAGS